DPLSSGSSRPGGRPAGRIARPTNPSSAGHCPAAIVLFVIRPILAAPHPLDPRRIGGVPLDGPFQPRLEIHFGPPPGFAHQLLARERVPPVVPRPVRDRKSVV